MNSKRGITFSVVIIAIVIMLIVISSASVIGSRAIVTANYEEFRSEVQRVSSNLNEYYVKNHTLPITGVSVNFNELNSDLKSLIIDREGEEPVLKEVNISLIKDTTIKNGFKANGVADDIYIVCEETQNVYYKKGFEYLGNMYFTYN